MHHLKKRFHYVAGSRVLPPDTTQDINLLRKAMLSLFKENTDTKDLIKNIRRVCSPLEFENIQKELKQEAQKSVSLQFHYDRALDKLWRKRAKEIFLDIETASPQDILIRAGHIFRPKFQCLVKNMATRFKSNDKKATPNKQELEFKIRSGDKNPFRMRQKESNPAESCFGRPEKHTDILAGMVFPNTNKMMEAFVDYFAPANNSSTVSFKPKYKTPDESEFGGTNVKTRIHEDIGNFKNVPFIVELQAHTPDAYKEYKQSHCIMDKLRAFEAWQKNAIQNPNRESQTDVVVRLGQGIMNNQLQRLQSNRRANSSLAKYIQSHDYHIVDSMPVIRVTSKQGDAHDHCLVPSYNPERNDTFLVKDNAYVDRISQETRVNRVACIARLHAIAHSNADNQTRLNYIPPQYSTNHSLMVV